MYNEDKSSWTQKNGTMSDKSAREVFGLTQEEIMQGIKSGKLQYRQNNMHGNPYLKLIRSEVESFVKKKYGENHFNKHVIEYELKEIKREINSMKRKVSILEKRKIELMNMIVNY